MDVQRLTPVLPVSDIDATVRELSSLLGVEPTFVDGDRWAQFDTDGGRLALAGTDRVSDHAGVMIKVADLDDAREQALIAGLTVSAVHEGPHERRCVVKGPDAWPLVLYASR